MKTLLICTDFSEPASHAGRYACIMAKQYKFGHITLFHAYHTIAPSTALPLNFNEENELIKASQLQLESLKDELTKLTGDDTVIRTRTEKISLGESINKICREENSDMIVMGITGKSQFEKTFIGSNTIDVSQNSKYPVLIVPAQAPLEPVDSILFACDLSEVTATTPLGRLSEVLELFKVPLYVLNVDDKNRHFSPQTPEEMYQMHHIFDKYKPRYDFIDNEDIATGIIGYAEKNNISLIITVPKHYDFIQQLFHRSITQKLIWQSTVPLLALHE